jgi:bifunctional ADP-heptose synthase (sugar kinase/adenylyltransferase)
MNMDFDKDEYVCIFTRDDAYLKNLNPHHNWDYHNTRNSDIDGLIETAKYLIEKGFVVIRVGSIVKRRYVDSNLLKLFEVYFYNGHPCQENIDPQVCSWLEKNVADFDLVIVPDFGNGFISGKMIQKLCDKARFLAVNTQMNSGNRGYHSINRYPRADFVSLNGPELRIATHNRHDSYADLAREVIKRVGAKHFAVTLGSNGALLLDNEPDVLHETPILSTKVLDRIGAGDTFLSLAGLCLGGGLPSDVALFVGSAAAALDVQVVCNREAVPPVNLYKYINTLLKP